MRDAKSAGSRWVLAIIFIASLLTVWFIGRDRGETDMALWCDRAVALVQSNEDLLHTEITDGYEDHVPALVDVFETRQDALLELRLPEAVDGLIPYGQDPDKFFTVFAFVSNECGYQFDVNNGRLPG